jgi:hypothetical protein
MTITIRPRWSLGRGKTLVPSRWQATRSWRRQALVTGAGRLEVLRASVRDWCPHVCVRR